MLHGCDRVVAILGMIVLWLVCAAGAAADTRTWTGAVDSDWHDPGNWSPAGVPSNTDRAVIASGTAQISSADEAVGSIDLGGGEIQISGGWKLAIGDVEPSSWSGGQILMFGPATVENAGTLTVTGDLYAGDGAATTGPHLLRVLAGGELVAAGELQVGGHLENDGTLRVPAGGSFSQSEIDGAPPDSGGDFIAQGTGVLSVGDVLMGAASGASGTGTIRFAGGTSTVAAGADYAAGVTELDGSGVLVFDDDGSTGALVAGPTNAGTRRGTGTLTVGAGASRLGDGITFGDGGQTHFSATSTITIDGEVRFNGPHTLRLDGTATWSAGQILMFGPATVENAGTLTVTGDLYAGDGAATTGPHVVRSLGGAIRVEAGRTLTVPEGLTLDGGMLSGDGTFGGDVANSGGVVAPGRPLTITGDYVQGPGGRLRAQIGPQHDRLQVTGTATLDGTLDLATAAGFDPPASGTFRIVDAGALAGAFADLTGEQATPGKRYHASYDPTGVILTVGLGPANTSRPSIPASGRPGDTIACDPGSWSGSQSFAYAWLRDGSPIATGPTYTLTAADGGRSIVCRVTATNADGSAAASSNTLVPTPLDTGPSPPPPPETGESFNVEAERGKVTVRLPDGRTVSIDEVAQIESGSVIDTRKGAVKLTSEGAGGELDSGVFSAGLFRVTQTRGRKPVTELRLVERLAACPKNGRASAAATKRRKKKRRLWGDADGSFRTRGKYGNAINDGTRWLTEDRCDGTFFRVTRGKIFVRRNGNRKAVRLRAGRAHLVRAPR